MVATVLRLRWRILGNDLARRPSQLVGFCFAVLGAVWMLAVVVFVFVVIAGADEPALARAVAVVGGAALLAGWVIGPVVIAGADTSVDAARLALFPLTRTQIMRALTATGLTGVPGIATVLGASATVVLWWREPAAAIVAVLCAALGVLTCVLASRTMTTWSAGLGGNRRGREIVGTLVLVLVIMAGPIITGLTAALTTGGGFRGVEAVAGVLQWTPLGAAWAAPADVAGGAWPAAIARVAIAALTVVALWLLWARALNASASSRRRGTARRAAGGALGLFGRLPSGPIGATWARSLTGWLRDPRYLRQLLVVPLLPALFFFLEGVHGYLFTSSPMLVAAILTIACYADVSYDGTAFASVLSTGIRGRDDRIGRLLGAASIGIPLMAGVALIVTLIDGSPQKLPAVLGGTLGLLLAGYAVTAVSSALLVVPVAAAGDSPFKSVPGQTFINGLLVLAVWGACLVAGAPAVGLYIAARLTDAVALGWATLGVGLVWGIAVLAVGVHVGGRAFDRRAPLLLARIVAFPAS